MPRRANTGARPASLLAFVVVLAAVGALGWSMLDRSADPFDGVTELSVGDYLENSRSLQGNVYKLQGTVVEQLKWTAGDGRLFSVDVDENRIPVKVPASFNGQNIQTGQAFLFKIEVVRGGILVAQDLQKT